MAIYLSRKLGATIGDIIVIINIVIFSAAVYLLSVEIALYSMITYLAASKTLDFIVEGIEEYIGVTIISSHNEEIRQMIINIMGRGVTVYSGKRGYGKKGETKETDILYTVITRLELNRLNTEIEKIEVHQKEVELAETNVPVILHLKDDVDVSRGNSIVPIEHLPKMGKELTATINSSILVL